MAREVRRAAAGAAVLCAAVLAACGSAPEPPPRVVLLSDVHFDPFRDPTLFAALRDAPEEDWDAILAGSAPGALGTWGQESGWPLVVAALDAVQASCQARCLVVFAGDALVHGFAATFQALHGSADEPALQRFTLKTFSWFGRALRARLGDVPVFLSLGNNDTWEGNYKVQPGGAFLAATAELALDRFLAGTAGREAFLQTWRAGGWYAAEPPGWNLVVVGLNTVLLSPGSAAGVDAAVTAQLDWLEATLRAAEAEGKAAWLVLHIPPGADLFATKGKLDAQGRLAEAVLNWRPEPQARFLDIVARHRGAVRAAFAGHTHMDEFRLLGGVPLVTAGAVSPYFGNDPAFKTFEVDRRDRGLAGYVESRVDLAAPAAGFAEGYRLGEAYPVAGGLAPALASLHPLLATDAGARSTYRTWFYAGHEAASPVSELNWPVYWCGIAALSAADVVSCVNGY